MEKRTLPILCYQLKPDAVLGILVGDNYQTVQKDTNSVKNTLKSFIQRDYKKYGFMPVLSIIEPKLKIIKTTVRPVYRTQSGSYPTTQQIDVPMPIVYGEVPDGGYECFIPLLKRNFHYFQQEQFSTLVNHFLSSYYNSIEPDEIFSYLRYPEPSIESFVFRAKANQSHSWSSWNSFRKPRTLSRLAVQMPQKKSERTTRLPDVAWEREAEVRAVVDKLLTANANVLVVGERGAGKSAIIRQAIKQITTKSKGQQIEKTFWQIMPQRITATAKYLGEWQQTVESLIEDLTSSNGVLWVEQIIQLLMAGGSGAEDSIAAFLIPFLQQNKVQLLGEVTQQELESMRRLLPGFVEYFQIVTLDSLPEKNIQSILNKFSTYAADQLKVQIDTNALTATYRLLKRYYPYEAFPGKGIKFLGRCITKVQNDPKAYIHPDLVVAEFVAQSGLPELFLKDELKLEQTALNQFFNTKIIGQATATQHLCNVIKVYKAGLNDPKKPIATMLFVGPTGVGKTAAAKALAEFFFGKSKAKTPLIRIDMSEFQHPSQVMRFIGYGNEVGPLVKEVRERPFAVVLLDEVEKAHPAVYDALLTVLDEGMLVDSFGRQTNFKNTIIIMTTNLGASGRGSIRFKKTDAPDAIYQSAIRDFFRPEFVNRIDQVVFFNSLNQEQIEQILLKELAELKNREGYEKRKITPHFSDSLIQHLVKVGFDEKYGARPLQRAIEQNITSPMATWLLNHPKVENTNLMLDYDKGLKVRVL